MLEFTAYIKDQVPGIEQMVARPEDTKYGDKAGDLYGRIAAVYGAKISEGVEGLYKECKEDLTHAADAITAFKIIVKSSSLPNEVVKSAGLADTIVSIKEWIAGKAQRLFRIVGDIGRWVKGFVERTKLAKKSNYQVKKAIASAKTDVDKLLAGA